MYEYNVKRCLPRILVHTQVGPGCLVEDLMLQGGVDVSLVGPVPYGLGPDRP